MAVSKGPFRMVFQLEKSTKNTHKYDEVPESGQPPRIGSLYVQKWALGSEQPPRQIAVTLDVSSENGPDQRKGE